MLFSDLPWWYRRCARETISVYRRVVGNIESPSLTVPLYLFFLGIQPFTLSSLHSCWFLSFRLSSSLSVFPPQGKGYSVLLFEVDICIIRLGCVIVSGLPHQRVLQRREGAVQPNNGWLPSSLTLEPACTCIAPTHPGCRPFVRVLDLQPWSGERERERVERQRRRGFWVYVGSGRAGVERDI